MSGTCKHLETAFRFYAWALQHTHVPSAVQIMARFDVSRATAYRWRAAYCAVIGVSSDSVIGLPGRQVSDPPAIPRLSRSPSPRQPSVRLAA